DQDVAGRVALRSDLDGVGVGDARASLDQRYAGVAEEADVDPVEPVELTILGGDEAPPVERGGPGDGPAEPLGVGEVVVEVGPVAQELLRDAPAQPAGAADAPLLADGDARAVRAGPPARGDAARSGADGEQVEVVHGHGVRSPRRGM